MKNRYLEAFEDFCIVLSNRIDCIGQNIPSRLGTNCCGNISWDYLFEIIWIGMYWIENPITSISLLDVSPFYFVSYISKVLYILLKYLWNFIQKNENHDCSLKNSILWIIRVFCLHFLCYILCHCSTNITYYLSLWQGCLKVFPWIPCDIAKSEYWTLLVCLGISSFYTLFYFLYLLL